MFQSWRYKRFHISYVLSWLAVGLIIGLFLGQFFVLSHWLIFVLLPLLSLMALLHSRRWYACAVVVIVGICIGLARGSVFMEGLQQLDSFVGKQVVLKGTITQDPMLTNGSNVWQAQLSNLSVSDKTFSGEVYTTILSDDSLKRGDIVTISAKALKGFGSFRLSMYRSELQHVLRKNDIFLSSRDTFAEGARRVMPEPEASLGLGFLVGQKTALSNDLTEQLKTVGLTHIIVASGYNLTILVRFARRLLSRKSRYLALTGSLVLVAGFVLVSGFSPSMNRAAAVTLLSLLAWYYGRKFHPVQLILYVAATSALWYPTYLWNDMGWLLSFSAFAGVLVVAPILTRLFYKKEREPGALARLVLETVSAWLMTLPIIVVSFGYIPFLALVANVAVAPVIPFAMFFTFVAGLVGLVLPFLSILAMPASILVAYVVAVVEKLSSPDWARWSIELPLSWAIFWYSLLCGALFYVWRHRRVDLRASSVVE